MSLVGYPENQSKMIEFLDALVHSSLHTSSKSIKNHLVQIDNEITRVQTHIQSTIKSSWLDFEHQSITGSSLYHQSIQLENQLNQIDAKLDDPQNGLVPSLLSAVKYHQHISEQHSESSQNLKAVRSLSTAYEQLSTLSELIYSDDLVTAVSNLPQTKSAVEILKQYQSASILAKRAVHRIQELEEDLKQRLIDDVRSCFTVENENQASEDSTFKFNLFVNARAPQQTQSLIQWSSAVEALQALSGQDFITLQFNKIVNLLIEKIISPLIDSATSALTHLKLRSSPESDKLKCVLTFDQQADGNWLDLYDSFRILFSTLQERLLTKPLQDIFSQSIIPLLKTKLLTETLDSGLPSSSRDKVRLNQLTDLLDQTRLFGKWLQEHDWISSSQKNSLAEWCEQVQDRFLQKVATRVLERARSEMITTQWESAVVPWEVIPEVESLPESRKDDTTGQTLSRATHPPPSSTTLPSENDRSPESPRQAASFRSLFNLVSSSSHHTPSSADKTTSTPPSQQPSSSLSPASKNFRSLFNFGTEPENAEDPGTSALEETVNNQFEETAGNLEASSLEETGDNEFEEDAWGLDESNDPDETDDPDETNDPDLDAWGFEQEDAPPDDDEVMRLRGGLPSPIASELDDDGWGWSDDPPTENIALEKGAQNKKPEKHTANISTSGHVPSGSTVRVEQLTISVLAQKILEIVKEVIDDVAEIEKPDFPSPCLSQCGPGLIKVALDVVDLFRIVMVVHHSKLLDSVPSLSVQFSNDCDWLSQQLQIIPRLNQLEETKILAERLNGVGMVVREKQLDNQRAALMECLNEAEGFVKTSQEDRFLACERACKQVTYTLTSLAQVWKPVMLREEYLRSLGRLVESVLQRILNEIEEQADIEEHDSKQLNTICKSLHCLIDLFNSQDGFEPADIYRYLPTWFKFCFLSELLEASMADIMWMYQEGHLSEFSQQEIVGLIRALFADSHLRAKNIDLILSNP
ncbi:hypothetical protein PCANC_00261 [Puccinia coronata f. sp. avenae]|uniref:ZW10 C-terminal helical domain-containing protein n=1 Tax=Puccinia coronata f. sp. avenae TaxID=200324 RepID=A0A2N5W8Y6_9BASI|nr:hypothetical protein PCANC_00261 [Puccinia coronata f. sp. avenae]